MIMKQTLEEAAIDFADYELRNLDKLSFVVNAKADYDNGLTRGFKAGADWQSKQSPWISVKEQLPEYSCWVLVAGKDYKYRILFYCGGKFYTNKSLIAYDGSVLSWMFIPSFDQILEANKDVLQRIKEKGD